MDSAHSIAADPASAHRPAGVHEIPMASQSGAVISCADVLARLPVGAYLCDCEGLITYYNPRAVELWGRAPRLGHADDRYCGSFKLYRPDGLPVAHDECWMALALRDCAAYEGQQIVIERPDGQRRTALAHANPLWDERGRLVGAVNVLMDITEHQRAQDAQAEMRSTLAHIGRLSLAGEMAAGLAHELNQPLTAIINYSDACSAMLRAGDDAEEIIRMLDRVAEQGRWAGNVVQRLRDFTRRTPAMSDTLDLNEQVRAAIDFIAVEMRNEGVTLRLETTTPLRAIEADPIQIQQVLLNLMRNGLEAMRGNTHDARILHIKTAMTADGAAVVVVSDTGPGVSEEILPRLFHPFMTTKSDGMGLGLAISKSIIDTLGGSLIAFPNAERGMAFQFTLPHCQ